MTTPDFTDRPMGQNVQLQGQPPAYLLPRWISAMEGKRGRCPSREKEHSTRQAAVTEARPPEEHAERRERHSGGLRSVATAAVPTLPKLTH